MQQFSIRQDGFKEIRNAMLLKSVPLFILISAIGIGVPYYNSRGQRNDAAIFPFIIPVVLIMIVFSLYRSVNRQTDILKSYSISIDNHSITRTQNNLPAMTINKADVTEIIKSAKGGLIIKGNPAANIIGIPPQIENHEKLEAC